MVPTRFVSTFETLLLERLPDVGPATVRRLIDRFGTAERALVCPERDFAAVAGLRAARARRSLELRAAVADTLAQVAARGIGVMTWDDDAYPARLLHLADPPPTLFLAGRVELAAQRPVVTIIGARRSTERARMVAERLGAALSRRGVAVASGLALGVDGAAHAGALRAGGGTIAVLGAGVDVPYPRAHRRLHEQIAAVGLLVSEFVPGTRAAPHHFPRRNRLLAALSEITVVVEAGVKSGSLITVDHALDLGREVWVVPGPIDAAVSKGSNRLLVDGARPLVSIDDFVRHVLEAFPVRGGSDGVGAASPGSPRRASRVGGDPRQGSLFEGRSDRRESWLERAVLAALGDGPVLADELAARFDVPAATILALLTTLELHGEVERLAGMRYRRAA